jgi:CHAD domain-containing protein
MLERELKFEVDEHFPIPAIEDLADGPIKRSTVELCSVYFDTSDADLLSHGLQLRRRDGDADTGWQLKIPGEDGRLEIRTALSDNPPRELTDLLTGMALGKPLANVATIRTTRHRYRLTEPVRGRLRAELADDHVHASVDHQLLAWREIEIESGPAARSLPAVLADRLTAAGARPARYPSKVARVLHDEPSAPVGRTAAERVLVGYLTEQIDEIFSGDLGLRRGRDPIHDTRVAIRRLRSTLRVFRKMLDRNLVGDTDAELKWFAGLLGDVRDCDVQRRRFRAALAELPVDLVLGPVAGRITSELQAERVRARREVTEVMTASRYLELLTLLQRWRNDPPIAPPPTLAALTKRARRAERKADGRLAEAVEAGDDALLHRARKAAKRARYAAELRAPLDKPAKKKVKRYKRIQRVLGDHQDGVVASGTLRRLALIAGTTDGENGFTFGLLYEREQQAAEEGRRRAGKLVGG